MQAESSASRAAARGLLSLGLGLALASGAGCATAGSTFRSGVGDRLLEEPPYYAGEPSQPMGPVAHAPIAYQPGASQAEVFDPAAKPGSPVAALLEQMNAYLDSLAVTRPLQTAVRGTPPDVRFGCEQDAAGDCVGETEVGGARGAPWLRLAVGRPSREWIASAQRALAEAEAERVLVLTLEVGQHWAHQRNLRGDKEVRLGTGHSVGVPWLTALDRPVQVLQLTGALVDSTGLAQRIGAEGLFARRTNVILGGFGVTELLSDDDIERVRTATRDDLPGRPLVWKVALHELLAELTGRAELRIDSSRSW